MALYLEQSDAVFLEVPKTGTTWVRSALRDLGIAYHVITPIAGVTRRHGLRAHVPVQARFWFATVRHPLAWLRSWYSFQASLGWPEHEPDLWHPQRCLSWCAADSFPQFVRRVLIREPGHVSRMYEWYVGPEGSPCVDAVARQETLADDLARILSKLGHEVSLEQLKAVRDQNCSPPVEQDLNGTLRQFVLRAERPALRRFYPQEISTCR